MYENDECLSLYIMMIKKWDSMNKSKYKYYQIWWWKSEIQWINRKQVQEIVNKSWNILQKNCTSRYWSNWLPSLWCRPHNGA